MKISQNFWSKFFKNTGGYNKKFPWLFGKTIGITRQNKNFRSDTLKRNLTRPRFEHRFQEFIAKSVTEDRLILGQGYDNPAPVFLVWNLAQVY